MLLAHAFIRSISSDNTYYLTLRNVMELAWIGRDKSRQLVTSNLLESFIEFPRVVFFDSSMGQRIYA